MLKYFMAFSWWPTRSARRTLVDLDDLRTLALFPLAQLRRELGAEVLGFVNAADFDLAVAVFERARAALGPLQRFLHRLALPQPETGDELLGFGKRPVDDQALVAAEADARAAGARVQAFAGEHHAGLDQ